ncbi:hypothetical protein PLESTB_001344400 [Pleodorina starrii]|uniref:Uncharacterized protein n=1 Tax=Pleodorina starrii TaxID=330485 RepID=A0A9W6F759_9CHLO|nr:hypothetical protein PLESTB_001344400 [Pleodorina starrii]
MEYDANLEYLDAVAVATTWYRLGKLVTPRCADEGRAFARRILGKTMKEITDMDLRGLSNTLWCIGKLKLNLVDEPVGPYLAHQMEEHVLQGLVKNSGNIEVRNLFQIWNGLDESTYKWSPNFLKDLVKHTLAAMEGMKGTVMSPDEHFTLSYLCINLAVVINKNGQTQMLGSEEVSKLAAVVGSFVEVGEGKAMFRSVNGFLVMAKLLQLPLAAEVKERLFELACTVPLIEARQQGLLHTAENLYRCTKLGYQPTVSEVMQWEQLLLKDLGGSRVDKGAVAFSWTVAALAACRRYHPSAELKDRLRRALGEHRVSATAMVRLCKAAHTWGVPIPAEALAVASGGRRQQRRRQ